MRIRTKGTEMKPANDVKNRVHHSRQKSIIIILSCLLMIVVILIIIFLAAYSNTKNEGSASSESKDNVSEQEDVTPVEQKEETNSTQPEIVVGNVPVGGNCSTALGKLMVINANYNVDNTFIANRRNQLVDLAAMYGIEEANSWNGIPMLDAEAAKHLHEMLSAYTTENPGHVMRTMSCFRSIGTSCGRLCAATGTSDHHTGYTCDLIDTSYGNTLDTEYYNSHPDWQWLKANSYKYGFIDRYPVEWAGSSMDEPLNVDENGTTGYYETWHYRYVGVPVATEIAMGKYNNGDYDSLEHYLKAIGYLDDLKKGTCKFE
ncbi:D-alanyl-D-alanine carboxypeptidase family protein [Candidatus Saccharibacteria bacterium]|nr:D-alanyl-D-alanine carboxypeptidase family protein [Candidatus Saccharibacteria bacterium]